MVRFLISFIMMLLTLTSFAQDELTVQDWIDRTNAYLAEGNIEEALESLNQALQLDPRNMNIYLSRGDIYLEFYQSYDLAEQDYLTASSLAPGSPLPWIHLGNAHLVQEEFESALQRFTQAIHLDSNNARAYYGRGQVFNHRMQYQVALSDFDTAIAYDPAFSLAYIGEAQVYIALEDYEQAVERLDRALELDSIHHEAYELRGFAYEQLGEMDLARADYDRAVEIASNKILSIDSEFILDGMTMADETIETRPILPLDPELRSEAYNKGVALFLEGNFEGAINQLTLAIIENPTNFIAYYWRGMSYSNLEKHRDAISDFSETIRLNPDWLLTYLRRGFSYLVEGFWVLAIEDFDYLIDREFLLEATYLYRGLAHLAIPQLPNALDDFTTVLELNPNNVDALVLRAQVYLSLQEVDLALSDAQHAKNIAPSHIDTYWVLGNIHWELGNDQEALQNYSEYESLVDISLIDPRILGRISILQDKLNQSD